MAATVEAAALTRSHGIAQGRIAMRVERQMRAIWPLLDPEDLDATVARWLRAAIPVIEAERNASALLSADYYGAFRTAELGLEAARFSPVLAEAAPIEQLVTSLTVTGPYEARKVAGQGVRFTQAMARAQRSSSAAATRHALNGGRDTIRGSIAADKKCLGWARAPQRAKPCAFCAMLAARGPVYRSERSADFKPHDDCWCQPEPIMRRDADWPAGAREFSKIYRDSTKGLHGQDAVNAFRRAYERG